MAEENIENPEIEAADEVQAEEQVLGEQDVDEVPPYVIV